MSYINMHDAKTNLSKLVEAIESGAETSITIARNGKPAAVLMPIPARPPVRLGLLEGKYKLPDDFDALDVKVGQLFSGVA
jgi:prevent-host-death family protein